MAQWTALGDILTTLNGTVPATISWPERLDAEQIDISDTVLQADHRHRL
jgi:hypothetical protein